jgi:hypothetical protein
LPETFQERVEVLLEGNRANMLSEAETKELDDYLRLEHVSRMLKLSIIVGGDA